MRVMQNMWPDEFILATKLMGIGERVLLGNPAANQAADQSSQSKLSILART